MRAAGHAIEARVYAEDPADGFLPQAGRATFVRWSPRARVDAALEAGQEVGTGYDPMLGKVIAHGATREAARRALVAALDDTAIFGVTTNLGFVRDLVASDAFRDAAIDTGWLDRTPDAAGARRPRTAISPVRGRVGARGPARGRRAGRPVRGRRRLARRRAAPAPVEVDLEGGGERRRAARRPRGRHRRRTATGAAPSAPPRRRRRGAPATRDRRRACTSSSSSAPPHAMTVGHRGRAHVFRRPEQFLHDATAAATDGAVAAPMPGTILSVNGEVGAAVAPARRSSSSRR